MCHNSLEVIYCEIKFPCVIDLFSFSFFRRRYPYADTGSERGLQLSYSQNSTLTKLPKGKRFSFILSPSFFDICF